MFGQFRRAALKVPLAHFDQRQKLETFVFPGRLSTAARPTVAGPVIPAEAIAQKTQIVRASKQSAERAYIVAEIFDHDLIDRVQNLQFVPKSFRLRAKAMKIFGIWGRPSASEGFSRFLIGALDRAAQLFAAKL